MPECAVIHNNAPRALGAVPYIIFRQWFLEGPLNTAAAARAICSGQICHQSHLCRFGQTFRVDSVCLDEPPLCVQF